MALLKSLIQRLLDSRTTPEEAGHSAMPSATKTTFLSKDEAVGSWGTLNAGTAPADGYLFVNASAEDSTNSEVRAQLGNLFHVSAQAPAPKGLGVTIPMSKGASYTVEGAFVSHITVGFVKAIGGGYQALNQLLLQGDVLCRLSRLYSSLRRSSCRVRRNGSEVKVFSQTQIPEQRSLLTTLRLSFIRLQVMDGLHSAETGHRSMSALPESWERVALTLKVISELQLRFGRGIPLVSIARQTISNRLRQNSFPAKGQRNTSLVGGASC